MDRLELIDETFDKDRTETYELSIQASLNGFSFAVKDTIRSTFIVLVSSPFSSVGTDQQEWGEAVSSLVESYPFLSKGFKEVLLQYDSSAFTLVPGGLFEVERQKDLFELTQSLPELFELHHASHTNGVVQIFSMPYVLTSAWLKVQPGTRFISPLSPLLSFAGIPKEGNLVQVDVDRERVIALCHSGEQLVAANCFGYKNANDAAYYILSFCKGLNVDFATASIHLSGMVGELPGLQGLLSAYFAQVSADAQYGSVHFSYQLLRHRAKYFRLFNSSSVCE